jgi:hypothetical protein
MKIFITANDIATMSGLISCGLDASKVVSAKMAAAHNETIMSLAPGVKQIQDDCEAGRA